MRQGVLTEPEFKALKRELYQKRCELCEQSIVLLSGKSICRNGLKFPYCIEDENHGFKLKEDKNI